MLEKKLNEKYTCSEIITSLRDMNFYEITGDGYIPTYTRTDFTDDYKRFNFKFLIKKNEKNKKIKKSTQFLRD